MARDIGEWLEDLGLGKYADAFAENEIDLDALPHVTEEDLKEIGLALGARRKLLAAIEQLEPEVKPRPKPTGDVDHALSTEAERRQLTVMFCDLAGSTALSERLDPEDLREVLRAYQENCSEIIGRYDGYIAKYIGDGLLIYFGYPQAHEDDAQRAVHAGLEIVSGTAEVSGRIGESLNIELATHIGIHTGLVVAGEMGAGERREEMAIVGETPNVAARLEALADPGSVLISESTHRLIEGLFVCESLGPLSLKGISEPVGVYRVQGETDARSRFEVAASRGLMPLVGREQEIALLLDRWEQAKEGEGQVVLLSGEAGIGKSRIARMLRDRVAAEDHVRLRYQCSPYHTNSALHPIIDYLERAAGFARDDPFEMRLDKLELLLAQSSISVQKFAPLFAALLSIPVGDHFAPLQMSPEQQKERTLAALIGQMNSLAARGPILIIFEDAHWIDPTSQELLDLIVDQAQAIKTLVLITYRPVFTAPWGSYPHVTSLTLNRLGRRQSQTMVGALTANKPLPEEVLDQILAKTDGVPLFVEELTKTVLEAGLLKEGEDRYMLTGPLPVLAIPTTLQDSLMARLDRLDSGKAVAQLGATIGRSFSHDLLERLARLASISLEPGLEQLTDAGLVFRQGQAPNLRYTFKHALIQDAAYQSQLQSQRRDLHRKIADFLAEDLSAGRSGEPEIVAHHFTEAKLAPQAIDYWERASTRAIERSTYAEAVSHLKRAIDLVVEMPLEQAQKIEFRLQMSLGKVYRAAKGSGSEETEAAYRRAHELSKVLSDPEQRLPVLYGLFISTFNQPNLRAAEALAGEIAETAKSMKNRPAWLVAQQSAGAVAFLQGRFETALRYFEKALAPGEANKEQLSVYSENQYPSLGLTYLSWTLSITGFPDQANMRQQEAIVNSKGISPFTHALALGNACYIYQFRRDTASIDAATRELMEISEARGIAVWNNMGRLFSGWSKAFKGETGEGLEEMDLALEAILASRQEVEIPYLTSLLAETCLRIGDWERASEYLLCALGKAETNHERWFEAELHRLRGALEQVKDPGDAVGAEKHLRTALELAREQGAKMWELRAAKDLARLWHGKGKREQARDLLSPIYEWFSEGHDTPDLVDARALLKELD